MSDIERVESSKIKPYVVRSEGRSLFYAMVRWPLRVIANRFFNLQFRGAEHVPVKGGFILAGIHQSQLDPIMYAMPLYRELHFMGKSELFKNPLFRFIIRNLNSFSIRRGEADITAMKEAIRRIKEGGGLLVFPEGTRSITGEIKQLEPGIGLMARRTGAPIIPVVINGTHDAWPKGAKFPHPCPVKILYGPPMDIAGLKPHAIMEKLDQTIHDLHVQLLEWK